MNAKKTQTKAFSDLIAAILLLCFEAWAWYQSGLIKTAKNAAVQPATLPRIMIIGMAIFTVTLLIQSVIKLSTMKTDAPKTERAESLNPVRDKGVLAALFVIALCCLYVWAFKSLGYVVVSFALSGSIMWLIGLKKPVPLLLISALVPFGMWLIFYKFLAVNIPMGCLQFLRELVDKI